MWIANTNKQSFISMAVHGQSLYRLNYPLKMFQWHHMCSSWNGKTGEWQLWVKAERVGRGFHNRLVSHVLEPHGAAFSGGPSITGPVDKGHHIEITMVQLYKVALSAGKAHRDHKHHHVHHFDHNGPIEPTTKAPTPAPQPTQPVNPLLANGQILQRVPFNLAIPPQQQQQQQNLPVQGIPSQLVGQQLAAQQPQQATITSSFANGQLNVGSRILQEQLVAGHPNSRSSPFKVRPASPAQSTRFVFGDAFGDLGSAPSLQLPNGLRLQKRRAHKRELSENNKKLAKRGLVMLKDGSIVDDTLITVPGLFDGLTQFGVPEFKQDAMMKQNDLEDEIREHDREPAEGEVQAVMSLCSKCQVEPFQGAIVLSWRELKTSTKGALKALSHGPCVRNR
uniref:CSON010308 protein n=1 Tax=Culicoides sonorensis TaxID=179676 RepID=A0A336MZ13_CULSO